MTTREVVFFELRVESLEMSVYSCRSKFNCFYCKASIAPHGKTLKVFSLCNRAIGVSAYPLGEVKQIIFLMTLNVSISRKFF
jgi:hypothetical protein